MSVYKTEEEQIDDLKRWVKSYGPSIVIGIIIAIVSLYSWHYWKDYQYKRAVKASILYQHAVDAYQTKNHALLTKTVVTLQHQYPRSPYAQYAVFIQAKAAVDKQDYHTADTMLRWIIAHSHDKNLIAIAMLRLGSVQIAQHQEKNAIETLQKIVATHSVFKGLALIKIADAYLILGDIKHARKNYEEANKLLPDAENVMPTLAIKLDNATVT